MLSRRPAWDLREVIQKTTTIIIIIIIIICYSDFSEKPSARADVKSSNEWIIIIIIIICHGELEGVIDKGRTKASRSKNGTFSKEINSRRCYSILELCHSTTYLGTAQGVKNLRYHKKHIIHRIFMDDIKISENENEMDTLIQKNKKIQTGLKNGI